MKTCAILGAGITGLTLAWYLQKQYHVTIFEQDHEVGGCIKTISSEDALFECGPRSFRSFRCSSVFQLINELGIQAEVIESSPCAKVRYLAKNGKLMRLPFMGMLRGALHDLVAPRGGNAEETVSQFFIRRFGKCFHDTFVDPLCAGIYASHPQSLNMQRCFGTLVEMEKRYRSLVIGSFFSKKPRSKIVSFKKGMQFLPKTIAEKVQADIRTATTVINADANQVITDRGAFEFDHVISTLPQNGQATTFTAVSLGFKTSETIPKGFGFLCASYEEPELLGIVFDSNVFREHNGGFAVRLSVMMRDVATKEQAYHYVQKYLSVKAPYSFAHLHTARLPCYNLSQTVKQKIDYVGSWEHGISVGDCISAAHDYSMNHFTKKVGYS